MFDGFIQIEDIEGESSDKRYADWMEITVFPHIPPLSPDTA